MATLVPPAASLASLTLPMGIDATRIANRASDSRWPGMVAANPQDCVEDGSIRRIGGPTSANFSPVRSTTQQLSGSVHFPNKGFNDPARGGFIVLIGLRH
jgi:hypothetical protein